METDNNLDDTFSTYRNNGAESDYESSDVIDMSISEVSFVKNKTDNLDRATVVPDSDEGSDTEFEEGHNSINDSDFIPVTKKSGKLRVTSEDEDDDSDFEDKNILSSATRLSLFGVRSPRANSDDESDFIESECEDNKDSSSDVSVSDLPPNPHLESFRRPPSPAYERSDDELGAEYEVETKYNDDVKPELNVDLTHDVSMRSNASVSIVEKANSIIALSSEDEDFSAPFFPVLDKKPSFETKSSQPTIPFVRDHTYPNNNVKYVSKQVKETELNKLNSLKMDLQKVKYLLETLNVSSLRDNGEKLKNRAEELAVQIKKQAEHVSNLIVEQEIVTSQNIQNNDFLSWKDLKTGAAAVKPSKFGTQALNTHMAQRHITLESLKRLHDCSKTRPDEKEMAEMPRGLKTQLMPHQLHALRWLKWREAQKPKGGILADDMGLGKTLTMISLMVDSKENNLSLEEDENEGPENVDETPKRKKGMASGGTLVVCPASLLRQWHAEVNTHCKPHLLRAHIHHGAKREVSNYKLAEPDLVITTYNLVQRELDTGGTLTRVNWERIILDEAHIVRNYKSQTARAIFQLRGKAKWCLTGTPVHNKDVDLFALLKFIKCKPFDDIALWKKWVDNKSTGGQERLFSIMKTLLLRRTKEQLLAKNSLGCLPRKTIEEIAVELPKDEMNVYQKVLLFSKTLFAQFLHQRAARNNSFTSFKTNSQNEEYFRVHRKALALHGGNVVKSHEILVLLLRLRQICNHAGLIHSMLNDEEYDGKLDHSESGHTGLELDLLGELSKLNIENEDEDIEDESEPQSMTAAMSKVLKSSNPVFNLNRKSAKVVSALKCLEERVFSKNNGDKAIVVSQWTSMLDIVEQHLKEKGIICSTLSGKVPVIQRQDVVSKFNNPKSDVQVLLLSLKAGGVGLNLIGGNHLLLLDPHWNPQLEAQAQDRIYRVGQTKPVFIYKFICTSTLEQTIKMIQEKKLATAESVLTGSIAVHCSKLTLEDYKLMFNMVGATV